MPWAAIARPSGGLFSFLQTTKPMDLNQFPESLPQRTKKEELFKLYQDMRMCLTNSQEEQIGSAILGGFITAVLIHIFN